MGFRRLIAGAVVLLAVPLLAGCSLLDGGRVLDIIGQDNAVRQQLSRIADALERLPGVGSVSQTYDYAAGSEFQLELAVDVRDDADLVPIADAVRLGYRGAELAPLSKRLVISSGSSALVEQTDFAMTAADLALDLEYRASVSRVIDAPLEVKIAGAMFGAEQYSRTIVSPEVTTTHSLIANYDDVVAIGDASVSSHSWDLPGLWFSGSLPARQYLALLGDLALIVPLHAYSGARLAQPTDGIALWGSDVPGWRADPGYQLLLSENDRETLIAVARAISDSGVVPASMQYPHGDSFGAVHFGDCVGGPQEGQYDERFVAELADGGVPVTVEDNLGLCAGSEQ